MHCIRKKSTGHLTAFRALSFTCGVLNVPCLHIRLEGGNEAWNRSLFCLKLNWGLHTKEEEEEEEHRILACLSNVLYCSLEQSRMATVTTPFIISVHVNKRVRNLTTQLEAANIIYKKKAVIVLITIYVISVSHVLYNTKLCGSDLEGHYTWTTE